MHEQIKAHTGDGNRSQDALAIDHTEDDLVHALPSDSHKLQPGTTTRSFPDRAMRSRDRFWRGALKEIVANTARVNQEQQNRLGKVGRTRPRSRSIAAMELRAYKNYGLLSDISWCQMRRERRSAKTQHFSEWILIPKAIEWLVGGERVRGATNKSTKETSCPWGSNGAMRRRDVITGTNK
jgi:hypothetical protein